MALQCQRQDGEDGRYRLVSWDDAVGHAVIWEYDREDRLQRRGVITHRFPGSEESAAEVVWHDANGTEVLRETQVPDFS